MKDITYDQIESISFSLSFERANNLLLLDDCIEYKYVIVDGEWKI